MSHVFRELQSRGKGRIEKTAAALPGDPQQALAPAPSPQIGGVPPAAAGVPQGPAQQQPWVGPKVGAFPSRRMSIDPNNPQDALNAAVSSISNEYAYLAQYPMEPRIVRSEGNTTIGEILVATPQGTTVSIPFVVASGVLQPPVAISVENEFFAIPNSMDGFSQLIGAPQPLGMSAGKTAQQTASGSTNIAQGPDMRSQASPYSYDQERSILGELPKYASFVDEISGTSFGKKVSNILRIPEDVIQFRRVPYGVIEKVASAGSFVVTERKLPLSEVPAHVLDEFSEKKHAVTRVLRPESFSKGHTLEKVASKTVTLYTSNELKPGMGVKGRRDGVTFSLRVLRQIGWDDGDPEHLVALSSKGTMIGDLNRGSAEELKWVGARAPSIPMATIDDMWKHPGGRVAVVAGKNKIYRPLGIVKKGKVYMGSYFYKNSVVDKPHEVVDVEASTSVVEPRRIGGKLFLPSDAKVIYLNTEDTYVDTAIEKVASSAWSAHEVHVEKNRLGYHLSGSPVERGVLGGAPIDEQSLSFDDAVFVLGALGVSEGRALSKVASADKGEQAILVSRKLETRPPKKYDVDIGFMKLAAAIPQQEDELLALQLLGNDTLADFTQRIPELYGLADDLAKLTLAAQIGLDPVDPNVAYQATRNVLKVADQVAQLKETTSGMA